MPSLNLKSIKFSAFILKVIALTAVFLDHIGYFFIDQSTILYVVMRIFGRIAFVLYALFIVEGVLKTKHPMRYLMRLFILYITLQLFGVIGYLYDEFFIFKNVFMTLFGGASLLVYIHHKMWRKLYLLIPPLLLIAFNLNVLYGNSSILFTFAGDYGFYGFLLIIGYYIASLLATRFLKYEAANLEIEYEGLILTEHAQTVRNYASSVSLFFITLIWYILSVLTTGVQYNPIQSWAIIAIPLLLLYSGKLGYNSKTWRTFYYLFYPVHLLVLALIFILL